MARGEIHLLESLEAGLVAVIEIAVVNASTSSSRLWRVDLSVDGVAVRKSTRKRFAAERRYQKVNPHSDLVGRSKMMMATYRDTGVVEMNLIHSYKSEPYPLPTFAFV
jgi:hypothetical protein